MMDRANIRPKEGASLCTEPVQRAYSQRLAHARRRFLQFWQNFRAAGPLRVPGLRAFGVHAVCECRLPPSDWDLVSRRVRIGPAQRLGLFVKLRVSRVTERCLV